MRIKIIIFLLLVAAFSKFCLYETKETKLQITEDANVREAPSMESNILKVANKGSTFKGERFIDNQNWYKIQFDKNKTGYIHESLITENEFLTYHLSKNRFYTFLVILISFLIMRKGIKTRCPECKRWFARKEVGKEYAGSNEHYETKNRQYVTRNRHGQVLTTTEHPEQVHMTTNYYSHNCICRKCGYEWTYNTKYTFEG